ncbi:methyltransferase domain-containing protein [Viridibacillus sp. YIM B01967]|uniref:Methyltransferase domain-containing protein n=1 Tax=Viridibacillus soli TaxID=2798301 RepID=A0ABS1H5Z4_9BACL|nr:methyltransferase domain-containing protein [Viridibacillus soli]MBK3494843.1 methyltransferase domain-containing protein [Viridibacillus soli]
MNKNNWKKIWGNRTIHSDSLNFLSDKEIFMKLKEANGFDVVDGVFTYEGFLKQYNELQKEIRDYEEKGKISIRSLFEVGCGSGANLYLCYKDGYTCGGIDYSKGLIESAKQVFLEEQSVELICGEAIELPVTTKYDVLLSNSVFAYFLNLEYATDVLNKMVEKSNHIIAIIDIHDKSKEEDYIEYRKRMTPDFEERYEGLPKLFYSKSFFEEFAYKRNLNVVFTKTNIEEYWNNDFVYNCYMFKK